MEHSKEYKDLKKFFHDDDFEMLDLDVHIRPEKEMRGRVEFRRGDETIELEGSSEDFVLELYNFQYVVQDGEERFVDLTAHPIRGTDGYYDMVDFFIDPPNEDRDEEAAQRVLEGQFKPEKSIPFKNVLENVLSKDVNNDEVRFATRHYFEVKNTRALYLKRINNLIEEHKANSPLDSDEFDDYMNRSFAILRDEYLNVPAELGYEQYLERCISDIEFHLERYLAIDNHIQSLWKRLMTLEGGNIPSQLALPLLLDSYGKYLELIRLPLRDLAFTLDDGYCGSDKLSESIKLLNSHEYCELTQLLSPTLRHGAFHMSYEIDETNSEIIVYSGKDENRNPVGNFDIEEVVKDCNLIRGVASAILFSFIYTIEILKFSYFVSPDFKFNIILNADRDFFVESS